MKLSGIVSGLSRHLRPVLLLAVLALCLTAVACRAAGDGGETGTATNTETTAEEPSVTEPETDRQPGVETEADGQTGADTSDAENPTETQTGTEIETVAPYTGTAYAGTVNTAASLANGVTAYYSSGAREGYVIENMNAVLRYNMSAPDARQRVAFLIDKNGNAYLTDTLDTFMTVNGETWYASATTGRANLYDFGYYCYNVHILDQSFGGSEAVVGERKNINVSLTSGCNDVSKPKKQGDGSYLLTVKSTADPFFYYKNLNAPTQQYTHVLITLATTESRAGACYFVAGSQQNFNSEQLVLFDITNDGEYHTYLLALNGCGGYTDKLTGIRFDIGSAVNETYSVREIALVSVREDVPPVTLDRNFMTFSDKIHDVIRFMPDAALSGIDAMGTELKPDAGRVNALAVVDSTGTHRSLTEVDWNTAYAVGFDIGDAGVFGYILSDNETRGALSVTLADGVYTLTQTYTPNGGALKRGQEVFMGHRLYTDSSHDFDGFLRAAECEKHPLSGIRVDDETKSRYFAGYDPLIGVYEFVLPSAGNFNDEYLNPDGLFGITFEIDGEHFDRTVYVLARVPSGSLECAAVLDESDRMLPVRIEVCKNFAGDGEEPYYTQNDSIQYGYAVLPLATEAGKTQRLTVLHLYDKWGQFRLKQLSSIRYHQAYYHFSTGVTETNCIAFYYPYNRLPDHRAMSQPYWTDVTFYKTDGNGSPVGAKTPYGSQPQHDAFGQHTFLNYTTSDGVKVSTESIRHHIDSAGPTYMDLTMHYLSNDGAIEGSIRHMEMPQYDENRAYYELDYAVRETVGIADFTNDFEIYGLATVPAWPYLYIGYLNADNECVMTDASKNGGTKVYTLGSQCPYFDYTTRLDKDPLYKNAEDQYPNLSCLIKDWDIVIGGERYTGPLCILEKDYKLSLTLDLKQVTLQPGDHIRVSMVLMPWGGWFSVNDDNVRRVRENTLLNPVIAVSKTDTVVRDAWMPKVRSTDGMSAEFTVTGGKANIDPCGFASEGNTNYSVYYDNDYNVTVRVYGLREFGTLCVSEWIDGTWQPVTLSGVWGFDGYAVLYDEDNTFSYSFNVRMNDAVDRTFRVTVK